MSWPCFTVRETDVAKMSLRRYHPLEHDCPDPAGHGYHNASVSIEDAPLSVCENGYLAAIDVEPYLADARWPARCACGYAFTDEDCRQVNQDAYYEAADGRRWPHKELPIGAMLDAVWMKPWKVGPDGLSLTVKLPPGGPHDWWNIDGPSYNNGVQGPGWTRTGEPPAITVNPSILTPSYHGWLQNGVLTDPL